MTVKDFVTNAPKFFIPQLSVDMVILGYQKGQLKCLLLQFNEQWMLPGGFVYQNESVEEAAYRVLKERSGVENAHLKFLQVFGDSNRNFFADYEAVFTDEQIDPSTIAWFNNRFVTLSYYSLVDIDKTQPQVGPMDSAWAWFNIADLPQMMMDHRQIAISAKDKLKDDIRQEVITYNLLPEEFTMPELHQLHQVILGEPIDRSRFQKKMLNSGYFERLPQLKREAPGRNPYLYRLKSKPE